MVKQRDAIISIKAGDTVIRGTIDDVGDRVKSILQLNADIERATGSGFAIGDKLLPKEAVSLLRQRLPFLLCPNIECGKPIDIGPMLEPGTPLMRGLIQRSKRSWWIPWRIRPYCAVICPYCDRIVAWEKPEKDSLKVKRKGPYR